MTIRKVKKYSILILLMCTGIVLFFCNFKTIKTNETNEILNIVRNDDTLKSDYGEEKKYKLNNRKLEDNFLLAYYYFKNNDLISAEKYFTKVVNLDPNKSNLILNLYSYSFLAQISISKNNDNMAIEYIKQSLNNIDEKTYNIYYEDVWEIVNVVFFIKEGQNEILKFYEKLINDNKISEEASLFTYTRLAPIYVTKMDYSKSIETNLKIESLSTKLKSDKVSYIKAKAKVDLALTYRSLSLYQEAKILLEESYKIEIKDKYLNAVLKSYALNNEAEINVILENYDLALKNVSESEKYKSYFEKDTWKQCDILIKTIKSQCYTHKNDFDNASKYLYQAAILLKKESKESIESIYILDKDIYYLIALGEFYEKIYDYDESEKSYIDALALSKDRENKEYEATALSKLINIYNVTKDEINELKYRREQFKYIQSLNDNLNIKYSIYAEEKLEYEKILVENIKKTYSLYILYILIIIFLISSTFFIRKLIKNNRHDSLTNVYNRGYFNLVYKKLVNKNDRFSIILIDIDNFKSLNDTYGHIFGDEVLMKVSNNLKNLMGRQEEIFRYGGEEFVIIARNDEKDKILELAENIRQSVENMKYKYNLTVTASLGVAIFEKDNISVLKRADNNLYKSKATGKNKVTF